MVKGLRESYSDLEDEEEFPEQYQTMNEIKSPLSVLHYNLLFEFKDKYPAKFNPDFVRDMIKLYSNPGDLVWDGCSGSGVVVREALKLGRRAIGTDINPKAVDLSQRHAKEYGFVSADYRIGDAREIKLDEKVDLIVSSLPFGLNIIGDKNHYSENQNDISNSNSYNEFFREAEKIIKNYYHNLKANGIMILDARDRSKDGEFFYLIFEFYNSSIKVGFERLARFYYELIPYRQMSSKDKDTGFFRPMPTTMDVIVMKKPKDQKLL